MLFFLTILVVLLTVTSFAVFVKRRNSNLLQENPQYNAAENFRPLFAPDEDDLRAFKGEQKLIDKKKEQEEIHRFLTKKAEKVLNFQKIWQKSPNKQKTVELIYLASQSESAKIYQETTENILQIWNTEKIFDLSADDLSQMLKSHFWLLPNEERTSGISFWLEKEIASLHRESLEKN